MLEPLLRDHSILYRLQEARQSNNISKFYQELLNIKKLAKKDELQFELDDANRFKIEGTPDQQYMYISTVLSNAFPNMDMSPEQRTGLLEFLNSGSEGDIVYANGLMEFLNTKKTDLDKTPDAILAFEKECSVPVA